MIDLEKLRALAKKASPGPWRCDPASLFIFGPGGGDMIASTDDGDMSPSLLIRGAGARLPMDENAAFIAACDPTTVLALLGEVESARADRDRWADRVKELEARINGAVLVMQGRVRVGAEGCPHCGTWTPDDDAEAADEEDNG